MVGQSKSEGVRVSVGAYTQELREFFRSREVRFGSPADLVAFGGLVSEPGPFQDEMESIVRSILFREDQNLGRGELLELLTVAVGGPNVDTAAQDMHASIRQIFLFVNEALRQRSRTFPAEFQADEEQVTAGDVLAAAAVREKAEGMKVGGRSPESGQVREPMEVPQTERAGEGRGAGRGGPADSDILFRAVTMSEADEADASMRAWEGSQRRWMVPAIVAGVIALGTAGYLAKPLLERMGRHPAGSEGLTQAGPALVGDSCVGPMAPGTSRSGLEDRSRWAHKLLDQKLYDVALPELKSIAQMDPGYPGVNLDESEALLHLRRPDDAREAVDAQIGVSECLAKLPGAALDAYCSAQFSPASAAACRPELTRIRQAAQLQAAMVHLELGHRVGADSGGPEVSVPDLAKFGAAERSAPERIAAPARERVSSEPATALHPRRAAPLPPATEADSALLPHPKVAVAKAPATTKPGRKADGDDSLMKGEGTDSSLGAYSKPQ